MMSSLGMVEATLPAGFRFHPRDDELICDYLMKKVAAAVDCSSDSSNNISYSSSPLIEVDLNKCEPWDIPEIACVGSKEFYFYSKRDRKYATGLRTNRATVYGYWKATGKDRPVVRKGHLVGTRKTLVFYQGRAPKGRKTNWVMHEFRHEGRFGPPKVSSSSKEDWVLCRVFHKCRSETSMKAGDTADQSDCSRGDGSHIICHDETAGSSTLPGLMDSYITFDQLTHPRNDSCRRCKRMNDDDDHHDDDLVNGPDEVNHDNNVNDHDIIGYHEQVPCFSIFSLNPTKHPSSAAAAATFSQIFSMDPNNSNVRSNNIMINNNNNISNDNLLFSHNGNNGVPVFGATPTSTQDGILLPSTTTAATTSNYIDNNNNTNNGGGGSINSAINQLSEFDKHVIKAALSQLTKIESSPNCMKAGLSPVSLGEAASSDQSYLSEVGLPTGATMWSNHY